MKDLFAIAGGAMLLFGLGLWSIPLALVVGGALFLAVSLVMHYGPAGSDIAAAENPVDQAGPMEAER